MKRLSLLLGGIIIALILAEALFFLSPGLRQRYDLEQFLTTSPRLERQLNVSPYLYRTSSIVGYERIPHSGPNINAHGLIGDEFDPDKPEGVFRILALGDSLAEQNHFVEHLRQKFTGLNCNSSFEIINAGVGAYEAWHYARFLKYKGTNFHPDMVIVSLCLNDFAHPYEIYYKTEKGFAEFSIPIRERQNRTPINLNLFRHSYLYRLWIIALNNFLQDRNKIENARFAEGVFHMSQIQNICQNRQIPLLCFIWPYLKPEAQYLQPEKDEYTDMVKVLNYLQIDFIDLHEYFPEEKRGSLMISPNDFIHPSDEGHKIVAQAIFAHLLNHYDLANQCNQ